MVVLEEVEKRADVWVATDHLTLHPVVVGGQLVAKRVPGTWWWQDVVGGGYSRHDVDLYRNRTKLWMSLPAVSKNARLDNLLYDEGRLRYVASMTCGR